MNQVKIYFREADRIIQQCDSHIALLTDPYEEMPYVGLTVIAAVAVYEMSIKYIFIKFSEKKHRVFGEFSKAHFERINGKIRKPDLETYVKRYGENYLVRFKRYLDKEENKYQREARQSIKESYSNIIQWRHQFAHECKLPYTATYEETKAAYTAGKKVIEVLYRTMQR